MSLSDLSMGETRWEHFVWKPPRGVPFSCCKYNTAVEALSQWLFYDRDDNSRMQQLALVTTNRNQVSFIVSHSYGFAVC